MSTEPSFKAPRRWWQYGHVWLLIAGPLAVVVASFITFYLATSRPDPVLPTLPGKASADDASGLTDAPAMQARNHAATGTLPVKTQK